MNLIIHYSRTRYDVFELEVFQDLWNSNLIKFEHVQALFGGYVV